MDSIENEIATIEKEIREIEKQLELDYSIEFHPVLEVELEKLKKYLSFLHNV